MSIIVDNHRINLGRTFNKYAVHLVAQENFDHSREVYSEYKKKNKFAIEESVEEMKDIYRGRPSGTFDKDKTVLVDIFVKHLPDDLKESWSCRESVKGIKGLRGPELDLQKRCTTIVNRVNRMIAKLRNIIFPKPAVITEKDIDETDDGIEELKAISTSGRSPHSAAFFCRSSSNEQNSENALNGIKNSHTNLFSISGK